MASKREGAMPTKAQRLRHQPGREGCDASQGAKPALPSKRERRLFSSFEKSRFCTSPWQQIPLETVYFSHPRTRLFQLVRGGAGAYPALAFFFRVRACIVLTNLFKHAAPSAAKAKQASTLLQKRNNAAFAVGHVAQPAAPAKPFPQNPRASSQISCVYSSKCPDAQKREPRM